MRTRAAIIAEFEKGLRVPDSTLTPDGALYHYTDGQGLIGILESKAIRATHFVYLNDSDEVRGAERIVLRASKDLSDGASDFQKAILNRFVDAYPSGSLSQVAEIYVASFSTKCNDLSQWRSYAAGGSGYCVGLRLKQPATSATGFIAAKLERVQYDSSELKALAKLFLGGVLTFAEEVLAQGPGDRDEVEEVGLRFMLRQTCRRLSLRNSSFGLLIRPDSVGTRVPRAKARVRLRGCSRGSCRARPSSNI
jgi:hypothetical protein